MHKKILVTGATGLVGKHIVKELCKLGAFIKILSTNPVKAKSVFKDQFTVQVYDWSKHDNPFTLMEIVEDMDAIINLAGENVGNSRWTKAYKRKIYDSRIETTKLLVETIRSCKKKPKCLISASGVGIYGFRNDEILNEESNIGDDFLAKLCIDWETEAMKAIQYNVRVVTMRTGIVLDKDEGALKNLMAPFKFNLGVYQGSGRQWFSWIHVDDLTRLYLFALENEQVLGTMNADSPNPVTNKDFIKTIGEILNKKILLPVPKIILRIAIGQFANNLVTGQRVYPAKAVDSGFEFKFSELKPALENLLTDKK